MSEERLSERLLHTKEAQDAYLNSPLFKCLVSAVRANEERMDPASLLGLLLAQVCLAREEWLFQAARRLMESPPLIFETGPLKGRRVLGSCGCLDRHTCGAPPIRS